ncbi:hypothetical protein DET48_110148 [Vibrio diazotrophicus]|jgi:hypothetical protein|uniref:Uncharacterized protein n=1 Tax=Vibrio diazotrophicus TaxID=685 RepID=A0A329E9L9_VIBDI|nr:hypothetical protein [Vibrio diazotrophicus]RAS64362.1 hypothetical protein DET48_110148 [Vibrio diazotrophicus]
MSNYYEQLSALQRMLDFDNASANTLSVMSLGGLSAKVRNLWWSSEASFDGYPSPQLQDSLSVYAQQCWQAHRRNPEIYELLQQHVQSCFSTEIHYRFDLQAHEALPELSLIKFWLASASCCCRTYPIEQDQLWYRHLQLTQALWLAIEIQHTFPESIIGYAEQSVAIVNLEKRQVILCTQLHFAPFTTMGFEFIYLQYPQ